jgi:cyclic-di-GMP-binding protein
MPSFDIVSSFDKQELKNAIDQTNRELSTRFDFKGKKVKVESTDSEIVLVAEAEFQTRQMMEILQSKLVKRGIDVKCLELKTLTSNLSETRQHILAREGIDKDLGRELIKIIKKSKLNVQAQMQDSQLRVVGKSRNVLQDTISAIKDSEQQYPLQFKNFRD